MRARTTTAALLLALVVPVSGGTTAQAAPGPVIDVVPSRAPWGGRPTVAWVDPNDQVIHDGALSVAVTPRLEDLYEVWRAGDGYLARDLGSTLYRIASDGTSTPLASSLLLTDDGIAVENGGRRVAVAARDKVTGSRSIDVLRVADGVVETRLTTRTTGVHAFRDGVVTFVAPYRKDKGSHSRLSTWDVSGQSIDLGSRRLRDPAYVDVGAGLMSRAPSVSNGDLSVVPLRGARRSWTVEADNLLGVSPDGRLAVTLQLPGIDSNAVPGLLVVRDARTGVALRTFRAVVRGTVQWETDRRFVVTAYDPSRRRTALLRLSLGGKVERASGFAAISGDRLVTR